jgi:A/G-specific adenine glycosylase
MGGSRKAVAGEPERAILRRLRAPLLRWYALHRRDLPWRRTRDPYAIWVSEIMLQQTQVRTVLPYYERFLARFPDVASLAAATEEEVLACWSGLGYYRRARALRAGAQRVVKQHDGSVPRDPSALRELPGIGRYTAGAISSIAFGEEEPVLDGNVRRILARVLAIDGGRIGWGPERNALWSAAADLVQGDEPGELNQALMELGALVCTPVDPRCLLCPVRGSCRARAQGDPEIYPARRPARKPESVRVAVAWVRRGDRVLLERPGPDNPLRGAWDLPAVEVRPGSDAAAAIRGKLLGSGLEARVGPFVVRARHGIMHRRLTLEVAECRVRSGRVAGRPELRWVRNLTDVAVSGATRKVATAVARARASRPDRHLDPDRRTTPRPAGR